MSHPETEPKRLIPIEEAAKFGAQAPPFAVILSVAKDFHLPATVHSSNVRAARREREVYLVDGLVVRSPIIFGERLVLVEATAPLIGFYNAEPGVFCGAYGSPTLHKAWDIEVAATFRPYVNSTPAIVYETVTFRVLGEHQPKPKTFFAS